jgi:hypothetical protein
MARINLIQARQLPFILRDGTIAKKKELGDKLVTLIKATIALGQSPVRDVGRFIPYKNPARYPGPIKARSPVNLRLTGRMLNSLRSEVIGGKLHVGIWNNTEATKLAKLEAGEFPLAGPRPVLPSREGEQFTVRIQREILKYVNKLVISAVNSLR